MNCIFRWFLLPQDIKEAFTLEDDSVYDEPEEFNDLVNEVTWWNLPSKLDEIGALVNYTQKFTWFRLPEQVSALCVFIFGDNSLTSGYEYSRWNRHTNFLQALDLIVNRKIVTNSLITHRFKPKDIKKVYEMIDKKTEDFLQIILEWE